MYRRAHSPARPCCQATLPDQSGSRPNRTVNCVNKASTKRRNKTFKSSAIPATQYGYKIKGQNDSKVKAQDREIISFRFRRLKGKGCDSGVDAEFVCFGEADVEFGEVEGGVGGDGSVVIEVVGDGVGGAFGCDGDSEGGRDCGAVTDRQRVDGGAAAAREWSTTQPAC